MTQTNIIDLLAETPDDLAQLRRQRPDATANAERSFSALFEPEDPKDLPVAWRYGIGLFVAGISYQDRAAAFYADLLSDEASDDFIAGVKAAIARGASRGPYASGDFITFAELGAEHGFADAFIAALDFAHLLTFHPKDATPAAIGHLQESGLSDDAIVSLAQLISFLAFQLRVAHGLRVLAEHAPETSAAQRAGGVADPGWKPGPRTLQPEVVHPGKFVNHSLGWKPWLADLPKEEFTDVHRDALIKEERIGSEYFRLLARDPAALKSRTLTDLDIFYNTDGGLGRAERELAATVVSRYNGCEYCASVHQARTKEEGGDAAIVDALLPEGVTADLGSPLWNALRDAALALTSTPFGFGTHHVDALRDAGVSELGIIDAINSSAFFNWANRLMLTLGTPDVPKRFR